MSHASWTALLLAAAVGLAPAAADQSRSFFAQSKLLASDGNSNDTYGISVDVSGNTAVVGAYLDNELGIVLEPRTFSNRTKGIRRSGGRWSS